MLTDTQEDVSNHQRSMTVYFQQICHKILYELKSCCTGSIYVIKNDIQFYHKHLTVAPW